jgi:biotin carboxyl carrier protein
MLKITLNDKHEFDIQLATDTIAVNGKEIHPDLVKISDTQYHLLLNHKSYNIVISDRADDKHLTISVNGNSYTVNIKDQYDLLLHDLGMDAALETKAEDIKAPMPGLVLDILVNVGDEVVKDTPLLILEAMKMENMLKASATGIVDKIHIKPKDAVEKAQVLISFK